MTPDGAARVLKRLEAMRDRWRKLRCMAAALSQPDSWLQVRGEWTEYAEDRETIAVVHDALLVEIKRIESLIARAERRIKRWK